MTNGSILIVLLISLLVFGCASQQQATQRPVNNTIQTTSAQINNRSLAFSIYTTNSSFLEEYKSFYKNSTSDILIDDEYNPVTETYRNYLAYWNAPQPFPRMLIGDSFAEVSGTMYSTEYNFSSNDIIDYDAENWNSTPSIEQSDQPYWVEQSCNAVHSEGYKFSYSPELDGLTGSQMASINWTCIDYFDIQQQALSSNVSELIDSTSYLIKMSKRNNPNLIVFVQLDMQAGVPQITSDINALANLPGVSGIMLTYVNSICNESNCNPINLDALVDAIKSIRNVN